MIRMIDIARETGVSRATVSYVLNRRYEGDLKISKPIIRKIQNAAKRMGYVRNELVNSVVTGKSRVIAVISQFQDFIMPVIKGCVEESAKYKCIIKLIPLEDDINQAIMRAVEFRVAGISAISLPNTILRKVDPKFFELNIPSIGLVPGSGRMAFDQKASSQCGAEYLISQGHRNIMYLGGMSGRNTIAAEREDGYRETMRKHHLPEMVLNENSNPKKQQELFEQIIQMHPDAVQCFNDYLALDLIHACFLRKLFVPDYFSILGFGNVPGSSYSAPHLTTVNEPYYETGQIMFRQIYQLIFEERNIVPEKLVGDVIERESVKSV